MYQKVVMLLIMVLVLDALTMQAQTQPSANQGLPGAVTQKAEPATIEGRVVRATDGSPLKKATVMAMGSQTGQTGPVRPKAASTDADGKFVLKDLEPGRYTLSVMRSGYARQVYGERVPFGPGTAITVTGGQNIKNIVFRMIPGGVVAGRIVDEDGEPVYQARVEVQRWMFIRGKRQLVPANGTMTNDLGEYRIAQLPPGRYFISATLPAMMMFPAAPTDSHEGYSQTFYPGVYDAAQAVPIEVKGGAEAGGINLRLIPNHAVRIRGTVKGVDGENTFGINVQLIPKGDGFRRVEKAAMPDEHGGFEIGGVMPGSYNLVATSFGNEKRTLARQSLEVTDSDIDGVQLVLKQGADISGRLRMEGTVSAKQGHMRVFLTPEDNVSFVGGMPAEIQDDMSFTLKGFSDGDYRVSVMGMPEDAYVKSAYVGSRDVLEQGFHLVGQPRPLEIVISTNGGRVEGVVADDKNNPFTGARVVLVPEETKRKRQDLFKAVSTDQYGRFSLRGVSPGAYTIYAWESIEEGAYQDPDFLKMYAGAGKSIRVSESEHVAENLRVIPGPMSAGN